MKRLSIRPSNYFIFSHLSGLRFFCRTKQLTSSFQNINQKTNHLNIPGADGQYCIPFWPLRGWKRSWTFSIIVTIKFSALSLLLTARSIYNTVEHHHTSRHPKLWIKNWRGKQTLYIAQSMWISSSFFLNFEHRFVGWCVEESSSLRLKML